MEENKHLNKDHLYTTNYVIYAPTRPKSVLITNLIKEAKDKKVRDILSRGRCASCIILECGSNNSS